MGIEKAAEWAAKYFLNPEVLCQSRPVGAYVHVGYEAHPEDTGSSGYRAGATSSFRQQQYYLALLSTTGETLAEVALPFFEKEFVAQRTREVAAELYALAVGAQFRKCLPDAVPDTDLPTSTSEKYLVEGKNWGGREADFSYEAYL
ncbi:MAG TPA: hypothetical protein PKW90_24990, partial [Myxococcota bacterium]|nr:hypothetical protein [Myxococcota bacterium]